MKPEIVRLGSLYLNDFPVLPGTSYNNKCLDVGDTEQGMELEWVQYNGTLYGIRCACLNISWDQLNDHGYIFGRPVNIDGKQYQCRCIKLRSSDFGKVGEWAYLLDRYSNHDKIWHWKKTLFWGQEKNGRSVVLAGGRTSLSISYHYPWVNDFRIGFRPVLVPMKNPLKLTEAIVGKQIAVCNHMTGKKILGTVSEFDDYDLVLAVSSSLPSGFAAGVVERDGLVIINRKWPGLYLEEAPDDEV